MHLTQFADIIPVWFLVVGLFFPRLTLFFTWMAHGLPQHDTPFFVNCLASIFIPRFLIAFWIAEHGAFEKGNAGLFVMFVLFIVVGLLEFFKTTVRITKN